MDTLFEKEQELRRIIRECEGLVIGFSGGVDSTLLALIGVQELTGVLLDMDPLYADALDLAVHDDVEVAVLTERDIRLRYLIGFR